MSTYLLRSVHNKLLASDILLGLNIAQDDSYPLCTTGHESRDHLFFNCEFSSYIWSLCRLKLRLEPTSTGTTVEECVDSVQVYGETQAYYVG